jgi:CheY-like chemotaxis protein
VDDNPFIRKMVCEAFVPSCFDSCVHAENGAKALVEAERVKPSAIILDLSMPVMNGLEAAPRLRRILPETPIVLYTLYEPAKLAEADISSMGISLIASKDEPLQSLVSKVRALFMENDSGNLQPVPDGTSSDMPPVAPEPEGSGLPQMWMILRMSGS